MRCLGLVILFMISCISPGGGTNKLIKESMNKDHTKKAVLFIRESGATVTDSYQVTITNGSKKFDEIAPGNTFRVDANHSKTRLHSASVNFRWLTADTLQIDYDKKLNTYLEEHSVAGITVIYKAR